MKNGKEKIKKLLKIIKKDYPVETFFIISNLINGLIIRIVTVKNGLFISPLLVDLGFLILVSLLSLLIKKEKRIRYFITLSIIFNIVCIVNSIYYHYYSSFASISLIANITFASDVSDAIVENVLKAVDLIYIWQTITLVIIYKKTNKKEYIKHKENKKKLVKTGLITSLSLFAVAALFMPLNAWSRLYNLWNRESVVMNHGIYVYQLDDFIQSLTPKITSVLGHDKALKKVTDYYKENKYTPSNNEYTNIFKGKNIIVIHAESMQKFAMDLTFNNKEVTPNLNKLANEGIFFSNFYSQVGVGTSSDAEFTFNTSLMPSTKGTVFVNYFDRDYISIPKLLKEQGYYTYSMHANTGEFWNRNTMHKSLGYDKFYNKDSYTIDETIGLGLSDKSFFRQSVDIMKQIKEEENKPFYSLLIMLSNHTPFSDLALMEDYKTTIDVTIDNQTVTRDYLNNTTMGNYLRSVHYADSAIGEFIDNLDKEGLLENTVLVIYGDHDARLDFEDFNLLYNYDPMTDTIKTENDEGYIPYTKYNYELDRKVPFIIWTKDQNYNLNVNTPMGMIDVLPTLGNMVGIHSDYQLGKDVMNIKGDDNTVTFIDGSFLTSKVYYNSPKGEIYSINNEPITEEYIKERAKKSSDLIEVSNDIITYDFIKEIKKQKEEK
ncbi:MAG: LTA synthase family protein [Bacilli bacterium]|nr:LTA synthase family protein [Bacilli bacterium]